MDLSFNATVVAQVFHFLLLLLLLRVFAYKRLLGVLDERRRLVAEQVKTAEGDREVARSLRRQQEEVLAGVRGQAAEMIARAEGEARNRAREIVDEARTAAEEIKIRAFSEIERERDEVRAALRGELAGLVLLGTEKAVRRVMDNDEHLRLVREAVGEVGMKRC